MNGYEIVSEANQTKQIYDELDTIWQRGAFDSTLKLTQFYHKTTNTLGDRVLEALGLEVEDDNGPPYHKYKEYAENKSKVDGIVKKQIQVTKSSIPKMKKMVKVIEDQCNTFLAKYKQVEKEIDPKATKRILLIFKTNYKDKIDNIVSDMTALRDGAIAFQKENPNTITLYLLELWWFNSKVKKPNKFPIWHGAGINRKTGFGELFTERNITHALWEY